jgi:D-alanyl-D-alanine carboxypeptidase
MSKTVFKIAASTLVVSLTMVACAAQSEAMRRRNQAQAAATPAAQAATLHEQAMRSIRQGQIGQALAAMENAVALSPRDAGYRLMLADIYMKSGRFESARATYADVLELNPGQVRATLSFALMHIALGRPQAAVAHLDEIEGRAAPADVGLAYALAGLPERAIEILAPAARELDATPRLRQNLALSYALAGDWRRARTIAAQDISPADLAARLQHWAAFAHPDAAGATRVASLLGVTPGQDPGQPVRLALDASAPAPVAPAPVHTADIAPAAAVPVPAVPIRTAEMAPVRTAPLSDFGVSSSVAAPAAAAPPSPAPLPAVRAPAAEAPSYYLPAPTPAPAPAERSVEEVRYAAAAQTLTRPTPAVVRTASVTLPAPVFRREAPSVRPGNSRFVVQLGAYNDEAVAEAGWVQLSRRFGLSGYAPLTMTFALNGRTMHRLSIAGFAAQTDAARLCRSIKARGGACFVRANAGDASVRWTARYARARARSA